MSGVRRDQPHVLAVDDDAPLGELFRELLAGEGYRVTVAAVPPSTAEVARLRPDLLLLDLRLGGPEDGWQVIARLAGDPATASVPVVVCSADIEELGRRRAYLTTREIGVVLKPFDLDDLLTAVRRGLARDGCRDAWGGPTATP